MMSNQFSLLLRSSMTTAGGGGFLLGFGLAIMRETTLATALLRGALVCMLATVLARGLVMMLFRSYLRQLQLRRQQEDTPPAK